ncbi:MAG: double-strand break repair helicase AddA [Hyphomicrobiaceae bacterium]
MMDTSDHEALAEATRATELHQARAADPATSAWVSANAGTGKTHVLTNRVLRVLLAGTRPERILCLTFTKAAAAEMSQRVFDRLASWVTAPDAKLIEELAALTGTKPDDALCARARDLFAIAIETPGGLKVQTIHAFCERLLQRFPLEAGIPPQFTVLDDETSRTLMREAIDATLVDATAGADADLRQALHTAVAYAIDDSFDAILQDALRHTGWIEYASRLDLGAPPFEAADALYRAALGVRSSVTRASLEAEVMALLDDDTLDRARNILATGGKNDITLAGHLARARGATRADVRIDALSKFFFTDKGEDRKNLMTKALSGEHPDVVATLERARDVFRNLAEERGHLLVLEATMALLRLASAMLQRFGELKAHRAALDFDDLIRSTRNLLSDGATTHWVLFKLDGGLDHILVDEAQDTSQHQWDIVMPLADEFFSGEGARDALARTIFAVGDKKQSIYGFQGAAPEQLAMMGSHFRERAEAAGQAWADVPLTLSFRTVAPILAAVDDVFAQPQAANGVHDLEKPERHAAHRLGSAGLVEIWETEKQADFARGDAWSPLADSIPPTPVSALADRIARTIRHWLDSGEILQSEGRPVRAGDIIVLVRKRNPAAPAIVSALKARDIPVAGSDRMHLTDQLAVCDLLALMDFLLLPEDDLALATVLKSPLIGLDDDDLMSFAPARRGSLWHALLRAAEGNPRYRPAVDRLKRWRTRSDLTPPFELLIEILDHDGMRKSLIERLGAEAAEPIDELIVQALSYDDKAPPSLQGFVDWLRAGKHEIKRDMDQGRDEVRVMTVHGAKGLEAPIVFLPDTCSISSGGRPGSLLTLDHIARQSHVPPPFLWPVRGSSRLAHVRDAADRAKGRDAAERNRLLYVAMTRPRDRLYVGGFDGRRSRDATCWYELVRQGLNAKLAPAEDHEGTPVWRYACEQTAKPKTSGRSTSQTPAPQTPPAWAREKARNESGLTVPLAPSRLAPLDTDAEGEPIEPAPAPPAERQPAPPAMRGSDGNRFLRGTITHALLQHLPTRPPESWPIAAEAFVERRAAALSPRVRASIASETLAVLRDPRFAPLFGPQSRAEVPIVAALTDPAHPGKIVRVNGQIDRIVELPDGVMIVDYKTNRPSPASPGAVPEAYLMQLAAYRLAVAQIFDGRPVRAALLWTDVPHIMEIPPDALDAAARRLMQSDPRAPI